MYWSGIWCKYKQELVVDEPLPYYAYQEGIHKYGVNGNIWYNKVENKVELTPAYTEYRYKDRELIYTHSKTESFESLTEILPAENISNIQKYVQYVIE